MQEPGAREQRFDIPYFEGVNSTVQHMLAKKSELTHVENMRAPLIGVLEKREGQTKKGTTSTGAPVYSTANYGIFDFPNDLNNNQGPYRVSTTPTVGATLTINVYELVFVGDYATITGTYKTLLVKAIEYVTVSEPSFFLKRDTNTLILDGTSGPAAISYLGQTNIWTALSDTEAQNIIGAPFDTTMVNGDMVLVNKNDYNRIINRDGLTVTDSTQVGSLYNSPRARKVAFYKNRIYMADFFRSGIEYKTSIIRSSFPMGIVALVNGDHVSAVSTIAVTDSKYFYSDTGMNSYDVYRGSTKIETITVTTVNETSISVTATVNALLSSDEIWVAGTFEGAKQFRWINNSTSGGQDVKQYDTIRLAGGDEDAITMLEPIGNILMVANRNAMLTWNDYSLQAFDIDVGCVSPNGYIKNLGSLYFIHYKGIFSSTGGMPVLLSRKVERYLAGATKAGLENAAAGTKGLNVFFAIGNVTLTNGDGSLWKVLPNVCLEYNIADQNWYVHTNVPAEQLTSFIDSSGREILLMAHGDSGKHIKEFLSGNTDDGAEIVSRADTQLIQPIRSMESFSNPIAIISELERGSAMKVFVSVEKEPFYELDGALEKGVSTVKITPSGQDRRDKVAPILCRRIQISFRDASKQRPRLLQTSLIFLPTPVTESQ